MKVLHIINGLVYGGAESLLADMVRIQRDMGLEVAVLVLKDCESGFKNKIISEGIPYIVLSRKMSVYNPLHIFKIIRYIHKYDIVHVHLFPAQYWAGLANVLCRCRVSMVTTEHSTSNRRRNNLVLRMIDNFLYCRAYNMTICCSDKAYDIFRNSFPKAKSISIPNGVDLERIESAKPVDLGCIIDNVKNRFIVTMVARLAYPKRQDTVIEALAMLPSDVCVVLVGGGDNSRLHELKRLAAERGVADRVYFIGIRDDVPSILKSSDIIVLSSEYEGLSLSSIEGMASGKPFIATNVDGLREVVNNAGLLFECGDAKMLATLISELHSDVNLYQQTVDKCLARAREYGIEKMVSRYVNVYSAM